MKGCSLFAGAVSFSILLKKYPNEMIQSRFGDLVSILLEEYASSKDKQKKAKLDKWREFIHRAEWSRAFYDGLQLIWNKLIVAESLSGNRHE